MLYFDRFDICEAYYVYAMLYHGGQYTETYKIFGRLNNLEFKPSPLLCDENNLTENSRLIFDNLVNNGYHGEK